MVWIWVWPMRSLTDSRSVPAARSRPEDPLPWPRAGARLRVSLLGVESHARIAHRISGSGGRHRHVRGPDAGVGGTDGRSGGRGSQARPTRGLHSQRQSLSLPIIAEQGLDVTGQRQVKGGREVELVMSPTQADLLEAHGVDVEASPA